MQIQKPREVKKNTNQEEQLHLIEAGQNGGHGGKETYNKETSCCTCDKNGCMFGCCRVHWIVIVLLSIAVVLFIVFFLTDIWGLRSKKVESAVIFDEFSNATVAPTSQPTSIFSNMPTFSPTTKPTASPSASPSNYPTSRPTITPTTVEPTIDPTDMPTVHPSLNPTYSPTLKPTNSPTTSLPPTQGLIPEPTEATSPEPTGDLTPEQPFDQQANDPTNEQAQSPV